MKLKLSILAIFGLCSAISANPLRIDIDVEEDIDTSHKRESIRENTSESASGRWPVIKTPYEYHQGYPSQDGFYWKFENIPFAQPPLEKLRFAEAKRLEKVTADSALPFNEGLNFKVCPQVQVGWVPKAAEFLNDYFLGNIGAKWDDIIDSADYRPVEELTKIQDQSEDCLTLDVMVSKRVLKGKDKKVPVLIWFFGGGFVFGSKTLMGPPAGLFRAASSHLNSDSDDASQDIIYVAINYRVGAFGWLAGSEFESSGGFENAGLSDQYRALEWVRENIEQFGGDPEQVTVMGESAGAASILHHIVSSKTPLFKRAIMQSPAFFPSTNEVHYTNQYTKFRSAVGAKDLAELRDASTEDLMAANERLTYNADFGTFPFGPVVDGTYITDAPASLLRNGNFSKDVQVIFAYNAAEGALFTPPWIRTKAQLETLVRSYFKDSISAANMSKILNDMYKVPTILATPYDKETVAMNAMSDVGVVCNVYQLAKAFPDAYRYFFNFFPGLHGQDIAYTFYPNSQGMSSAAKNVAVAMQMQRYFTNFVKNGNPNRDNSGDAVWNTWSASKKVYTFGGLLTGMRNDALQNTKHAEKCEFWNGAPYAVHTSGASEQLIVQGGELEL